MCVDVRIGGATVQTQGDLASVLPALHFLPDAPFPDFDPDGCLCWVDLRRTAEAAGWRCTRLIGGSFHRMFTADRRADAEAGRRVQVRQIRRYLGRPPHRDGHHEYLRRRLEELGETD